MIWLFIFFLVYIACIVICNIQDYLYWKNDPIRNGNTLGDFVKWLPDKFWFSMTFIPVTNILVAIFTISCMLFTKVISKIKIAK